MAKKNTNKAKWIWLSVLVLLICIAAAMIVLTNRLNGFLLDDSGAISLVDEGTNGTGNKTSQSTKETINPGFETSDDNTIWNTETKVEIFRVAYVNGEQVVTVNSDDGEKVIAPGTENSYTFKLKNTGNVALDYTVEVEAYVTPAEISIPIPGRICRYDGEWVVGDNENYESVSVLNTAKDAGILGAGKYTYYTLDWLWPFESGNDEFDTMLGDLATDEDLVFTIVIKTTANESADSNNISGLTSSKTGDDTNLALWIVLAEHLPYFW